MEISERNAHCMARLFQGVLYGGHKNIFDGCMYCKYRCWNPHKEKFAPNFDILMQELMKTTGVDLRVGQHGQLRGDGFPYKRFLKNSNERVREFFRNFFKDI